MLASSHEPALPGPQVGTLNLSFRHGSAPLKYRAVHSKGSAPSEVPGAGARLPGGLAGQPGEENHSDISCINPAS